jgi:hypothetical protein
LLFFPSFFFHINFILACTPEIDLGFLGTIPPTCILSVSVTVNPIGIFEKIAGFIGLVLEFVLDLFKPLLNPIETKIDELKEQALNELQKKFNGAFDFDELLVLPKMYQQLSLEKIKKIKDDILEAIPINKMIAAATAVGAQINIKPQIGAMCGEGKKVQRFKVTGSGCKLSDTARTPTHHQSCPGWDCANLGDTCNAGYTCCSTNHMGCTDGSCWHSNSALGSAGNCNGNGNTGGTCFESSTKITYKKAYVQLARNTVCTTTGVIRTVAECKEALRSLGLKVPTAANGIWSGCSNKLCIGTFNYIPSGCSNKPDGTDAYGDHVDDHGVHFNAIAGSGGARSDLAPICSIKIPIYHYGPNEKCSVKVLTSGEISSYRFNTEYDYDKLTIGNRNLVYSGTTGPSDVAVYANDVITWSSDGSQERTGFKICMQSAEALRIDRMKHNRIKLQSLSRYDCPSTVWKKRKYYHTLHYTSGNLCTASYNNVKSQATTKAGIVKLCTDAGGTFIGQCFSATLQKLRCQSWNSLYTCSMNPKVNSLKKCIGECKSDAHCAPGLKCMVRDKGESVPGCTGRGRLTGNGYTAKYCYDPTYNYLSGYNHPTASSSQLQACVGECDSDEHCAKVDGVQLECVQRNAGEKVPGCVGEGEELDGGLVSWDYCTNPVKVKQAADAAAAQVAAQEAAEEAAEAKERAADIAAAKASEESSKRKAAIAAAKESEEISKRQAVSAAKAKAKAIAKVIAKAKAKFCKDKPADTACLAVAKQASAQANAVKGGSLVSIVVQSNPTQAVDWSKSGLNTLDLTSTSQQFKFYKLKSTATSPLGTTVNDWHTDGVTSPLRSGDTVAWYHPAANQLYDCAWGTCTKQRWHGLPAGHWGSPYRIYKEGGAVGDVIALDSAIYFDRMFHGVFNPTKSIAIGKSTAIAGVSMASKTIFVLKAQDARSAAVARAAKVVEERAKATQRAAEQRTKAAKVVEERTKATQRAAEQRTKAAKVVEERTKAAARAVVEQRTKATQRAAEFLAKKVCKDKPGFQNGHGHGCQGYVTHGWCKNGAFVAGQEWTGGVHFKFPENSCCACNRNLKQCENQCKPGGTYNNGSPPAACTAAYCDQYLPGKLFASRCIPGNPGHTYAKSECQSTCNICPKQCENQCKPGGTYNNGSPPAACTAAYCDQYLPGKLFASRCIPGNPGHTYAKSECQSTCNICPK